jgi:hypothetical protein
VGGNAELGVTVVRDEQIAGLRRLSQRRVQIVLALLSLGALTLALAAHLLSERLGSTAETARVVATAFLLAATLECCLLLCWERMFRRAA